MTNKNVKRLPIDHPYGIPSSVLPLLWRSTHSLTHSHTHTLSLGVSRDLRGHGLEQEALLILTPLVIEEEVHLLGNLQRAAAVEPQAQVRITHSFRVLVVSTDPSSPCWSLWFAGSLVSLCAVSR